MNVNEVLGQKTEEIVYLHNDSEQKIANLLQNATEFMKTYHEHTSSIGREALRLEWIETLDQAYQLIVKTYQTNQTPELRGQIAEILFQYGRSYYGGKMELSRCFFSLSLDLKLSSLGLIDLQDFDFLKCKDLESLKQHVDKNASLHFISYFYLGQFSNDVFASLVIKQWGNHAFKIAETLRWLGHACQNLKDYRQNLPFFSSIYGKAECILGGILKDSSFETSLLTKANWEMVELLYNTTRFMYDLSQPRPENISKAIENTEKKLKTLDLVIPFLNRESDSKKSKEKHAQILNIQALGQRELAQFSDSKEANYKIAFNKISEAIEIADHCEGFDRFLRANFYHNKASTALLMTVKNDHEIADWLQVALDVAKGEGFDHFYHWVYLMTGIKLELMRLDKVKAKEYFDIAEQLMTKYEESFEAQDKMEMGKLREKFS